MRNRRIAIALIALLLCGLAARHPSASIEVLTHEASDPNPRRINAALDMGVMAVSVVVTWTAQRLVDAR